MKNASWLIDQNEVDYFLFGACSMLFVVLVVCCGARCLLSR